MARRCACAGRALRSHPDPGLYRRAERGRAGRGRHQPRRCSRWNMRGRFRSRAACGRGGARAFESRHGHGPHRLYGGRRYGACRGGDGRGLCAAGACAVGVFTHFAAADSTAPEDIAYTRRQYDILCAAVEEMAARGCTFAVKHCCNSAGTFAWPEFHLDMVRPGIILYGEQPSADTVLPGLVPRCACARRYPW